MYVVINSVIAIEINGKVGIRFTVSDSIILPEKNNEMTNGEWLDEMSEKEILLTLSGLLYTYGCT